MEMKKYIVMMKESNLWSLVIEAENEEGAKDMAESLWNSSDSYAHFHDLQDCTHNLDSVEETTRDVQMSLEDFKEIMAEEEEEICPVCQESH
jgi:hypothetical protein